MSVQLPSTWKVPKFQFGQVTGSGIVVGMVFYPLSFGITQSPEAEWHYLLVESFDSENVFEISEKAIEELSFEQSITSISIEIEYSLERVYLLAEQLRIACKKNNAE